MHTGLNYNHLFDSAFFNAEFGLKYNGWALSYEYMDRKTDLNPITTNSSNLKRALLVGNGYNTRLSYCTKSQWEIAGRYSYLQPNKKVHAYYNAIEQYGVGITKYFIKHKAKAQFNVFYNKEKNLSTQKIGVENLLGVFQFEIGI